MEFRIHQVGTFSKICRHGKTFLLKKLQELQANHQGNTGGFSPIFPALKIQAKIVILQEIQELQAGVPCLHLYKDFSIQTPSINNKTPKVNHTCGGDFALEALMRKSLCALNAPPTMSAWQKIQVVNYLNVESADNEKNVVLLEYHTSRVVHNF